MTVRAVLARRAVRFLGCGLGFGRLLVPSLLHRIDEDPRTEPDDQDAEQHLTGDEDPSSLGRGSDVSEADSCEHRDREVQRIGAAKRLAEVGGRNPAHDEIACGELQEK